MKFLDKTKELGAKAAKKTKEVTCKVIKWAKENPQDAIQVGIYGAMFAGEVYRKKKKYDQDHMYDRTQYDEVKHIHWPVRRTLTAEEKEYFRKATVEDGRNGREVLEEMGLYRK